MARDGSGTYTRVEGPYVNGVVADADEMNNELDDISDAITDSINSSGTKAMGANWSMGGFRLTDLAAPSSANDAARKAYVDSAITAAAQPLDPTLTAFSALSWSSGNPLVQFTAADTISLTSGPTVSTIRTGAGTVSANAVQVNGAGQGFYSTGANVAVAVGGALIGFWQGAGYQSQVPIWGSAGSVSAPSIAPSSADPNSGLYAISSSDNIGLALGGSKVIDFATTLIDISVATRAPMAVSSETSGTLTAASSNKQVLMSADCTINDGVHAANDWIFFSNDAGTTKQIIADTGMTLRLHGTTTTGTRTIAIRGGAAVRFNSASDATVYGDVT